MAYQKKSDIIDSIKVFVITLSRRLHDGEGRIYTDDRDWLFTSPVMVKNEESELESHRTKVLQFADEQLICIDDHGVETKLESMSRTELLGIGYMLMETCEELLKSDDDQR